MTTRQRLSDNTLTRIRESVRVTEGMVSAEARPPVVVPGDGVQSARFVLTAPLDCGSQAPARRLARISCVGQDAGRYRWAASGEDELVYGNGSDTNYYAQGAHVTCVKTTDGWMVVEGSEAVALPSSSVLKEAGVEKLRPHMVMASSGMDPVYLYAHNALNKDGVSTNGKPWLLAYFALGGTVPEGTEPELLTGDSDGGRVCLPCFQVDGIRSVKVAYEKYDGRDTTGVPHPQKVLDYVGQAEFPGAGELWGPGPRLCATKTLSVLPLYWWEIREDDYVARDYNVNVFNPHHPHNSDISQAGKDAYALGVGGFGSEWYRIFEEWTTMYPAELVEFWGASDSCGAATTGIPTTEDKPDVRSKFFIAPNGYWEDSSWNWGWARSNYRWSDGYWIPNGDYGWFGPWGGWGYWGGYWGGSPPPVNSPGPTTGPPDPPCGDLIKREVYGYIVWEWGWPVLANSTNKEDKTCVVRGPIRFLTRLVGENEDQPEPTPF